MIAVVTVVDRLLVVPFLYERPTDIVLHLSLEIVIGAALWAFLACLWASLIALDRRVPEATRKQVRLGATVAAGIATGIIVYVFVVRRSAKSEWLAPGVWWVLLLTGGVVGALALHRCLRMEFRSPRAIGLVLLSCIVLLQVTGLHRWVRHYGNLQNFLLLAVTLFSTIGSGLVLGRARFGRATLGVVGGVLGASLLALVVAGSSPSHSTRRAVLVWGGAAKQVILNVVWHLADGDGDGTPSWFWGPDPDDRDPDVTPLTGPRPSPSAAATATPAGLGRAPSRNLLWVIVDTVRTDSFERLWAASPSVQAEFATFARYLDYVSCSSRTTQVIHQLFDDGLCTLQVALMGGSFLQELRQAGYHDESLAFLELNVRFSQEEHVSDDRELVERALERLAEPGDRRALFVHLKGGHQPYDAPGETLRARYDNLLLASFESVARLVRAAADDRWVVVVMGDHGESFGEHSAMAHATTLYESELRTPFLIRAPGLASGPQDDRMSCAAASAKALYELGVLERRPTPPAHQYAALDIAPGEFGHLRDMRWRALRLGAHKAIWSPDLGIWEFYDLRSDPGERRSLADSHAPGLETLRETLEELTRACPPPPNPNSRPTGRK